MGRVVNLVVWEAGEVVGKLPPFTVETPWWQEVAEVIDGARRAYGAELVVLRLLDATLEPGEPHGMGGEVTYLVEAEQSLPRPARVLLSPVSLPNDMTDTHPQRMLWAQPGQPASALRWADSALAAAGRNRIAAPHQIRTWNLSAIWMLETDAGTAWLKLVPPFLGHEGTVIDAVTAIVPEPPLPRIISREPERVLLDHIAGEDQYDAPLDQRLAMVPLLVEVQAQWAARDGNAMHVSMLPSWGWPQIAAWSAAALADSATALTREEHDQLEHLIDGLRGRFEQLTACGIPETLIHGDYRAGNVRWDGERMTILDWGDSGIGHPLLDMYGFTSRTPLESRPMIEQRWIASWQAVVPGSDPDCAARLLRPIAPLRLAGVYQRFLHGIEPSERRYHATDVPAQLHRAAQIARAEHRT